MILVLVSVLLLVIPAILWAAQRDTFTTSRATHSHNSQPLTQTTTFHGPQKHHKSPGKSYVGFSAASLHPPVVSQNPRQYPNRPGKRPWFRLIHSRWMRVRARLRAVAELEEFTDLLRRVAVLVASGVDSTRAMRVVLRPPNSRPGTANSCRRSSPHSQAFRDLGSLLDGGIPVADACHQVAQRTRSSDSSAYCAPSAQQAWALLSVALNISQRQGSSTAELLQCVLDEVSVDIHQLRTRNVSLAGPGTTAGVLFCMPLVAAILGRSLGVNTLAFLVGDTLGYICVAISLVCLLVGLSGFLWMSTKFLVRSESGLTNKSPACIGLVFDVLASGAKSGASDDVSLRYLVEGLEGGAYPWWDGVTNDLQHLLRGRNYGLGWRECHGHLTHERIRDLSEVLAVSQETGAPVARLLQEENKAHRDRVVHDSSKRGELMATILCIPISLAFLPMFLFVGLVPIALGMLRQLVG